MAHPHYAVRGRRFRNDGPRSRHRAGQVKSRREPRDWCAHPGLPITKISADASSWMTRAKVGNPRIPEMVTEIWRVTMWKVENVRLVKNGHCFHISNSDGRPVVLFAYETQAEANAARTHVQAAVEKAVAVLPSA